MARPLLSAISIILLAGGIVLQIFVILSGAVSGTPLNNIYFLQASTNGIVGQGPVPNPARWTYFSICGEQNGKNSACGPTKAAVPFDPRRNFDADRSSLPAPFANNGTQYYYLSRVAWAFYIIAIFFAVMALLLSVTALCSRLAAKLTGLMTIVAVVMQAVCASLMTYAILIMNYKSDLLTILQCMDRHGSRSIPPEQPKCPPRHVRIRLHLVSISVLDNLYGPLLHRRQWRPR